MKNYFKRTGFFRSVYPTNNISDEYLKNKYKEIEAILKNMQSIVCNERPDCCLVLEERDKWIISLDRIKETKEYNDFINQLIINSNNEELINYTKYHLKLN